MSSKINDYSRPAAVYAVRARSLAARAKALAAAGFCPTRLFAIVV